MFNMEGLIIIILGSIFILFPKAMWKWGVFTLKYPESHFIKEENFDVSNLGEKKKEKLFRYIGLIIFAIGLLVLLF